MAKTIGLFEEIPRTEELVKKNIKNKLWLKGGLIAVCILWCISIIFLFFSFIFNSEAGLIFKEVASFPLSQIYFLITSTEIESSTFYFFIFFFLNSLVYFIIGVLIGLLSQKLKESKKTKRR